MKLEKDKTNKLKHKFNWEKKSSVCGKKGRITPIKRHVK